MSANRPALAIRRPELGHLGVGAPADITVLRQVDSDYVFEDVVGATRQGSTLLQPVAVYLGGKPMEVSRRPFEEPFILGGHHATSSPLRRRSDELQGHLHLCLGPGGNRRRRRGQRSSATSASIR